MYDDGFIPLPSSVRLDEIGPTASFISKKMLSLRKTLSTSDDIDERIEVVANMGLCQSSINLLMLAYLSEDASFVDTAKHLYRGIEK
jgi:hypothetical protein